MDPNNPVIQLCIEGTRAEYAGRREDARQLAWRAWEMARDDYEACIAAHYMARYASDEQSALTWNLEALARARAAEDGRVRSFYPSLYLNLGRSYEITGNMGEAARYYKLAAGLRFPHQGE